MKNQTTAFFTKLTALNRPDGSSILLCKTLNADGSVKQYDMAANFHAEHVEIDSIEALEQHLISISKDRSSCIVQGLFTGDEGVVTARNGQTMLDFHNALMVFDFDNTGIQVDYTNNDSIVDGIIKLVDSMPVEIGRASSVFKLSSTAGFNGKTELKGHLYVINKTSYRRAELKAWAAEKGIGCDLGVIHPVQIVYTSDPIFQTGQDHIKSRIYPVIGDGEANVIIDTSNIKVREVSGSVELADPAKKTGIIGAFCRAFPLEDCIDRHLSDVFSPSASRANHYDYLKGSGSVEGCFVTNCGNYLVNTHASDPMKGRSSNSWDLVMMHRCGGDFEATRSFAEGFTEVMVELKGAAARYGSSKKPSIDMQIEESNRDMQEAKKRKEMNDKIWGDVGSEVTPTVVREEPTLPCVVDVSVSDMSDLVYYGIPNSKINWAALSDNEQLALLGDPQEAHLIPILQTRLLSSTKSSYLVNKVVTPAEVDAARKIIDAHLDMNRGAPTKGLTNATLILSLDPHIKELYAFNEFSNSIVLLGDTPWRKVNQYNASNGSEGVKDVDDSGLILHINKVWGIEFGSDIIRKAVNAYACLHNKINPVQDYLKSLKWDGKQRLDTVLIRTMGVVDNIYSRAVTRKFFVGAVSRGMRPASKMDFVLVMLGNEGLGKSIFSNKICPWPDLFGENPPAVGTKEAVEFIQGKWIVELGECASMTGKESEKVKAFVSGRVDRMRLPYDTRASDIPRTCVFIANSNLHGIFTSAHGNRRFWPVVVTKQLDITTLEQERDQLWAEAVQLFMSGEELYLEEDAVQEVAKQMQRDHMQDDGVQGLIEDWLDRPVPKWWLSTKWEDVQAALKDEDWDRPEACCRRMAFSYQEVAVEALGHPKGIVSVADKNSIGRAMAAIGGWSKNTLDKSVKRGRYGPSKVFVRDCYKEGDTIIV